MAKKVNSYINGQKYFRIRTTIGYKENGKPLIKNFYGTSKKDAEIKRDTYLHGIQSGLSFDYDKILFSDFFNKWFNEILAVKIAESSLERYEQIYRLKIKNCTISTMKIKDIAGLDVQKYYNQIYKKYNYDAVISVHKLINPFFSYCYEEGYLPRDIMKNVNLPKKDEIESERYPVLKTSDIQILLNELYNEQNVFIYVFALYTGLRQGEILALNHNDINLINKTINVNKSLRIINRQYQVKRPKSKHSIRTVPISNVILPYLIKHIQNEKNKYQKLGLAFCEKNILFSSKTCGYRDGRNVRRSWLRLQKKLNIKIIDFKGLRHTFCTKLSEQGVPLKTASVIMGHSNIMITSKYYTHVDLVEKEKAIEKLNNIF